MNPIVKSLVLSAIYIGFVVSSPLEFKPETEIAPAAAEDANYRLSRDVLPTRYDIKLTPYLKNETTPTVKNEFTFDGLVTITMSIVKIGTTQIEFHMNDLEVTTMEFKKGTDVIPFEFKPEMYNKVTDKYTLTFDPPLATGSATLQIYYRGYMRDDMAGFYKSYYEEKGHKVWMATTQFQSTDARRAFPCFDEPGFKAVFQLTLVVPPEYDAISNTKVFSNETINAKSVIVFAETPKMSTYLLAFIVSKYQGRMNADKTFGVYTRPEAIEETALALDFGQKVLKKLGDYVGINYYSIEKIDKLDMAAIPDFDAGAMENWGLATYRETGVLYYPQDTPSINEQRIVAVIAHEQTHMWFGDLVTCNWWSETWLNEGFARFFQYFGTKEIYTDWDLEEQFVVENLQQSMQLDSTDRTHPMTDNSVKTKAQASGMFDNISYNKAASVIRMLSYYLGTTVDNKKFKDTLNRHLSRKQFENVIPDDFFTAINEINPGTGDIARWFAPWTQTPGFPLVTAELKNQSLILTQKRFMQSNANNQKTERYNIPITYTIDSENYDDVIPKAIYRLEETEANKTIELPKKPKSYVILNPKQTNYYRVNYDAENWKNIKEALYKDNHDNIHVMNRAQIVDDLFNLARAGIVKYNTAVDIIRYIKKEKHYIPWLSAFSHGLTHLSQRVEGEKNAENFAWFINDLTNDIYEHLKFAPQSSDRRTDIYNRVNVATWACKYGHEKCVKDAKEAFANFMKTPTTKINKDQRSYVYCNGVRYGGKEEFDFLYKRYETENIAAEQLALMVGMACTKDKDSVTKYIDRIIKTNDVRAQDRSSAITNMLNSNPEGKTFLYNYITANVKDWKAKMGGFGTLSTIAGRFTTAEEFTKYETFLKSIESDLGDSYNSLLTSMKTSKDNLQWDAEYMKDFMDHLAKLKNSAPVKAFSIVASIVSLAVLIIFN